MGSKCCTGLSDGLLVHIHEVVTRGQHTEAREVVAAACRERNKPQGGVDSALLKLKRDGILKVGGPTVSGGRAGGKISACSHSRPLSSYRG